MIENRSFTIETVVLDNDDRHGKFVCEPLERGYGITLGNSLRRVLLSYPLFQGQQSHPLKLMAYFMNFLPLTVLEKT